MNAVEVAKPSEPFSRPTRRIRRTRRQAWIAGPLAVLLALVTGCVPDSPPPAVGIPTCRAKPGKVDVTWSAVNSAARYEVLRASAGGAPAVVATVTNTVYADFGLSNGTTYTYTVVASNAAGAAPASPSCSGTPNDRETPPPTDLPPEITSQPLVEAFENVAWFYDVRAIDPEGLAVAIETIEVPFGMSFDPASARLTWWPLESQIGSHAVQVRATDPAGNATVQSFTIAVEGFDGAPSVTSIPVRFAEPGQAYGYPATGFDPEGQPLAWSLGAGAPAGMTIGAQSGAVQWTPAQGDVGERTIVVEVRDPAGNLGTQSYALDVIADSVQLLSPSGQFTVSAGTTLTLPVTANHPKAGLRAAPLPQGATLDGGSFRFTPTLDQVGRFDVQFEARLAGARDVELVRIDVTRDNVAPQISAPGVQTVNEGESLSFVVTATDPDGDPVSISAPGLAVSNAIFNELTSRFDFTPGFDQEGSHFVEFVADDGTATSQATVQIDVIDVAPPSVSLNLVVDPVQSPNFARSTPITGSVVGEAGPPPAPAPLVFLTGLAPTELRQGRSATVILDGLNTEFADGEVSVQFGDGVTVESLRVVSPTRFEADVSVASDAAVGVRQVVASTGDRQVPSVVAFSVRAGAARLTGQVVDPFTNQPVAGATVTVPGTNAVATTAADGSFALDDISGGASRILVTAPNFEILDVAIALGPNAVVDLDLPIGLSALARPFNPGGTLPRASVLASVIDRGVSNPAAVLDIDQAEALVQDTLIVVGGTEVGVLDENGQQLNPQLTGPGLMSLTTDGVRAQASALVGGQVIKLGDLIDSMIDLFVWRPARPVTLDFIAMLQRAIIEAWDEPNDPSNAMAIVLFNPGNSLSASPPILTRDTPLTRFQAFLILSSYLLETTELIEDKIDEDLLDRGIDPTQVSARPSFSRGDWSVALGSTVGSMLDWVFGAPAHAQGTTFTPPNSFRQRGVDGRTFRKIFAETHKAAQAEAVFAAVVPAAVVAVSTATAILTGSASGGLVGVVAATGAVTAILDGFLAILWQKYILGMFLAATLQEMSPQPPLPTSSRIEGDKFIFEFDQSVSQSVNRELRAGGSSGVNGLGLNPDLLNYTYQLYLFPDLQSVEEKKARRLKVAPEPLGNGKYRFVVPAAVLGIGANYLRIATVQFVRRAETTALDANTQIAFDPKSTNPPSNPIQDVLNLGKEVVTKIPFNLNIAEITNLIADNDQLFNSTFGPQLEAFSDRVGNAKAKAAVALNANAEASARRIAESNDAKKFLLNLFGPEVDQVIDLKDLATSGRFAPGTYGVPGSPATQQVSQVLNLPAGTAPDAATIAQMQRVSGASEVLEIESLLTEEYRLTKRELRTFRDEVAAKAAAGAGGTSTTTVFIVDPVPKTGGFVDVTVPNTPAGATQVRQLEFVEQGKISVSGGRMTSARANLDAGVDEILNLKGGANWAQWKLEVQEEFVQFRDHEIRNKASVDSKIRADLDDTVRRELADVGPTKTTRKEAIERSKAAFEPKSVAFKAAGDTMAAIGITSAVFDPVTAFVQGVQILESEFSPVHVFVKDPRQSFQKPPVIADPDITRYGGVVSAQPNPDRVDRNNTVVDGLFVSLYPDHEYDPDLDSTGFPPQYLTTDSQDRIYSINGRTTTQFGGRIFRWDPARQMQRIFAGSVMFYSTILQYGRPAAPLALAVGEYWDPSEPARLEDLFVANTDFIENPPRNEILRVPVHLLERPPYSNGLGVDRVVGQTYVRSPEFQFTGPTDMKVVPDFAGIQRLLITDEDTIWMVRQDLSAPGQPPQLIRLLQEAGRRWSGIAVDVRNNVYVADFASGDLLVLTFGDLVLLEGTGGNACTRIVPGLMKEPEYIALDHDQQKLIVSDAEGVHASIPLPTFVEGLSATSAFLVTLGKELLLPLTNRGGCPDYRIVFPEGVHTQQRSFRIRFQSNTTGSSREVRLNLPGFGAGDPVNADELLADFLGFFQ